MIPTPEQLAAVLPNVSAGIDGGNWTKESARIAWATKVLKWVKEASPELRRLERIRIDPEFPGQTFDPKWGRWCHDAADLYRWLTRPNEVPDALQWDGITPHSDERGSDGTHGPREPENDAEPFELTKALKACHATPHPQPEFRTDPVLEALLDEEEAIARGDRTAHMSAQVVASNDWPPPAKGSHESDLGRHMPLVAFNTMMPWEQNRDGFRKHGWQEYATAQYWSRSR